MKIPYLSLTLGQQGGIGYPPIIVQYKNKWYAISDSRKHKPPRSIEILLEYVRRKISDYGYEENPKWHSQGFVWKKWHNAPKLTWEELRSKISRQSIRVVLR